MLGYLRAACGQNGVLQLNDLVGLLFGHGCIRCDKLLGNTRIIQLTVAATLAAQLARHLIQNVFNFLGRFRHLLRLVFAVSVFLIIGISFLVAGSEYILGDLVTHGIVGSQDSELVCFELAGPID